MLPSCAFFILSSSLATVRVRVLYGACFEPDASVRSSPAVVPSRRAAVSRCDELSLRTAEFHCRMAPLIFEVAETHEATSLLSRVLEEDVDALEEDEELDEVVVLLDELGVVEELDVLLEDDDGVVLLEEDDGVLVELVDSDEAWESPPSEQPASASGRATTAAVARRAERAVRFMGPSSTVMAAPGAGPRHHHARAVWIVTNL